MYTHCLPINKQTNKQKGDSDMVGLVRHLLCKHEDLSGAPQPPHRTWAWRQVSVTPVLIGQRQKDRWGLLLSWSNPSASSGSGKRPHCKKQGCEQVRESPDVSSLVSHQQVHDCAHTNTWTHTCTYTCIYAHTQTLTHTYTCAHAHSISIHLFVSPPSALDTPPSEITGLN